MEKRFETRKREIEQDALIDKKDLAGAAQRLDRFLAPFFESLPRSETRENASRYVQGLLSDLHRKNVESIAYRFGQDRRALQFFVGAAQWDHQMILNRIAENAAKLFGEDDGILVFDPSAFKKDGKMSAGVARQYLGRFGKVDNGQVGTFMAYWTYPRAPAVNPTTHYAVYQVSGTGKRAVYTLVDTVDVSETSFTVEDLAANTRYTFVVRGLYNDGIRVHKSLDARVAVRVR